MPTPTPQVTYAGVPLLLPDERLQAHLDRHWRPGPEWQHPGYTAPGLMHLPRPYPPEPTRPRLGVLRWPTGASRFGVYYGLADSDILAKLDAAAPYESQSYHLTLSDGIRSVSPVMYMLPPRPLATGAGNDLYLITLVDRRYFWPASGEITSFSNTPRYATWAALFDDLFAGYAGGLGNGLASLYTLDSVPAAYKSPSTRFNLEHLLYYTYPISVVADAAAASIGCRIIFGLDGSVRVIRPENARTLLDTQYNSFQSDRISGGRIPSNRLGSGLPSVQVLFPVDPASPGNYSPIVASPSIPALTTIFPNWSANSSGGVFNAQIYADLYASASASDRSAYAAQIGEDWYRWQSSDVEAVYQGIAPWAPTGMEDALEFEIGLGPDSATPTAATRVVRPPLGDWNIYGSPRPDQIDAKRWVQITGGSDAAGYSGYEISQTAPGTWTVNFSNPYSGIRRAPSNTPISPGTGPPAIRAGQVVSVVQNSIGILEIEAVDSLDVIQFTIYRYTMVSGNLIETPHTVTITGRGLTASVS